MQDNSNHISLTNARSISSHNEESLGALIGYWSSRRKGHEIPKRSDIDPRGISQLLENAFIAERITPRLARFRIAGTHLGDLLGMEVRGMPISALIAAEHRENMSKLLVEVFDRPAIVRINLEIPANQGCSALKGVLLLLPLRSDLGDTARALGCLLTEGQIGRSPRRFNITGQSIRMIDAGSQQDVQQSVRGQNAPSGPVAPFTSAAPSRRSERPYLRLVRSEAGN